MTASEELGDCETPSLSIYLPFQRPTTSSTVVVLTSGNTLLRDFSAGVSNNPAMMYWPNLEKYICRMCFGKCLYSAALAGSSLASPFSSFSKLS